MNMYAQMITDALTWLDASGLWTEATTLPRGADGEPIPDAGWDAAHALADAIAEWAIDTAVGLVGDDLTARTLSIRVQRVILYALAQDPELTDPDAGDYESDLRAGLEACLTDLVGEDE